jgi:hypothetical protein
VIRLLRILLRVLLLFNFIRLVFVSRWVLYAKYDTLAEQYCSSAKAFNVVTQSITDILAEVRKERVNYRPPIVRVQAANFQVAYFCEPHHPTLFPLPSSYLSSDLEVFFSVPRNAGGNRCKMYPLTPWQRLKNCRRGKRNRPQKKPPLLQLLKPQLKEAR